MKTTILFCIGLAIAMTSCTSVEKMVDQGDFDSAIHKSLRKLAGKEKLKEKYVLAAEEAFRKITTRDMARIETLRGSEQSKAWREIISIYERIGNRQEKIAAFLPLISRDGYKANFSFVRTTTLLPSAIDRYLELVYNESMVHMDRARVGSKLSARDAFHHLDKLWAFTTDYRDASTLQSEAAQLGIQHVWIRGHNLTPFEWTATQQKRLLNNNFRDHQWIKYHFSRPAMEHQTLTMVFTRFEAGPEQWSENRYEEVRKIRDGYNYVLDENGNVKKDSLGNDIKVKAYKKVYARVLEVHQQKEAYLDGELIFNEGTMMEEIIPFNLHVGFNHRSATFQSDKRALDSDSRQFLNHVPLPYPSDYELFDQALDKAIPVIGKKVDQDLFTEFENRYTMTASTM